MSEILRDLPDGLVMRTADPGDAEELAAFNIANHSDDPEENPEEGLGLWSRDLLSGRHPTVSGDDVTLVVDESAGGKIVSSCVHISQTWACEDLEFPVGRPELIATDPEYRRRGLVREQMNVLHDWSEERGELVQAITGIPWYYRQFGYEMTLQLGGGRRFLWEKDGNFAKVKEEDYRLRPATEEDVPLVAELYAVHSATSLFRAVRDERVLAWEISGQTADTTIDRRFGIVEDRDGEPVGYVAWRSRPPVCWIGELAVRPGNSLRAVALFLTRELRQINDEEYAGAKKKVQYLLFAGHEEHPINAALRMQADDYLPPYMWYMRVPDVRAFLEHLRPVLERRLHQSVMAGHSGDLKLNFYRDAFKLVFEKGRLTGVEDWQPKRLAAGDVRFADHSFLQMLFGTRSVDDLRYARADSYPGSWEARILIDILFPKRGSQVLALS
ncbi:MAG: GNAT family N-acetyltransferase [Planctomycetota bacterium]